MFNFFKKKPKVEFVCLFPEIKEIMPITPAGKIKFDWIKPAIDDWKKTQEEMKEFGKHNVYQKVPIT